MSEAGKNAGRRGENGDFTFLSVVDWVEISFFTFFTPEHIIIEEDGWLQGEIRFFDEEVGIRMFD